MSGQKICFLSGLPIESGDMSIEHYAPKSRVPTMYANATLNKHPAIKIINFVKGDLLPCEWHLLREERLLYALENWRLKPKQRKSIHLALKQIPLEPPQNPCDKCVLNDAIDICITALAKYNIITR